MLTLSRALSLAAAALLFLTSGASAQVPGGGVYPQPPITVNHCASWASPWAIKDAGAACGTGSGTITSITNSDGTLTLSPNPIIATGTVSLNLSHANTWSAVQSFADADLSLLGASSGNSILKAPSTGGGTATLPAGSGTLVYAAGAVTSIAGTANQINQSGSPGAVTLSLSSTLILPGTINKLTLTQPATGATLTIPDGTTLNTGVGGTLGAMAFSTDAANLTGTLADARLSANVPLLNAANIFTAAQVINLNGTAAPSPISGAGLLVNAANGVTARVQAMSYGAISAFTTARANGTAASPTGLVNADQIGGVNGYGWTSAAALAGPAYSYRGYSTETWSATANGTKACIATTANTTTTLTDKLCVDQDGTVILTGKLSAQAGTAGLPALYFGGDTTTGFSRQATNTINVSFGGTNGLRFEGGANGVQFLTGYGLGFTGGGTFTSIDASFYRSGVNTLAIGTGSNSGAGGSLLLANITASGASVIFSGLGTDAGTTDSSLCLRADTKAVVTGTGTLGICLGTSSKRFKRDIVPMVDSLTGVLKLKLVNFRYIKDYGDGGVRRQNGLLAEDVAKVFPDCVTNDKSGKPTNLDAFCIVFHALKAQQEMAVRLAKLEAKR